MNDKNDMNNQDDFLTVSDDEMNELSQYICADDNETLEQVDNYINEKAGEIIEAASEKNAAPDPNQISMFDKEAFLKQGKIDALNGLEKTASSNIGSVNGSGIDGIGGPGNFVQRPYTSPMLTLSDYKLPKSTPEFFKWCKYYYTFDPLIAGAINAMSTFPVTEMYLEDMAANQGDGTVDDRGVRGSDDESDTLKLYKRVLFKKLNITNFCILVGIDYHLYGNCFVFGEMETGRDGKLEWAHVVRLDPNKIYIDFNSVTQEKRYRWVVPDSLRKLCKEKKPIEEYNKIPEIIKAAVAQNKSILLNSKRIYHFARPSDSAGDGGVWGTPVIAHVMKLITYRNILRQAQEAIAREHIVPMRVYYMQSQPHGSDYTQTSNWDNVANNLAAHISRSVRDPNYKVVSPYPLGVLNVGGEGRQLLLTPEIEQIQNEILAGMNVPREFLFGGVSYSGTSISLRILENQFITYRLNLSDFVNDFLIRGMAEARGDWTSEFDDDYLVGAKFVDMKMVDDVQQKQLIVDLNRSGKLTDDYMWKALGMDPDKIRAGLRKEAIAQIDDNFEIKKRDLETQMMLQKYQQELAQKYGVSPDQQGQQGEQEQDDNQGQGANPDDGSNQPQAQQGEQGEQGEANGQEPTQTGAPDGSEQITDISDAAQQGDTEAQKKLYATAKQLLRLPEAQREQVLQSLPQSTQKQLIEVMQALEDDEAMANRSGADMRPLPNQKPPRRKGY